MDIQFRCNSVSHFDKSTGRYVHCSQLLQADEQHIGQRVRCPRCQQYSVVPAPAVSGTDAQNRKKRPEGKSPGNATAQASRRPVDPVAEGGGLDYASFDRKSRCRKCGALLDAEGKCTACYYLAPVLKPVTTPIDRTPAQLAGFQLWFRNIMTSGVGLTMFAWTMHILAGAGFVLGLLLSIGLGGDWRVLLIIATIVAGLCYVAIVWHTRQLAHVPAARLPFYLRPFWYGLLVAARALNWQKYDSTLAGRVIIDVRGKAFSDRDLLELDELPVCQVLDAEGTDLTDAGLGVLHSFKNLRCLVVRKTHVTREGVYRLQQANPRCWIWY